MKVHIIMHAAFEKPGIIEDWVMDRQHEVSFTHTYRGERLPNASQIDFLIIMGGPQSPLELDKYPYLIDEIDLTRKVIDQKKPVLGICLGAQIIGESLGAKTEHSPHNEIGIFPLQLTPEGMIDPIFKNFPETFDVMHWHNDMPGVPPGSAILAHSLGCPRQVIRYAECVYGLQCHMEMTHELVQGMVEHFVSNLNPGKYIQTAEEMLSAHMKGINDKMIMILEHLTSLNKEGRLSSDQSMERR